MRDWIDDPPKMRCGHPLAARKVHVVEAGTRKGLIETRCWACQVAKETKR